jgi:BASS family bile acid:Na+ symporter
MRFLDPLADGLSWLGRHGTRAVAISMFVGIAVPPLGTIFRPYFPETVVALLILSFLRVDPDALRRLWARPALVVMAAVWTMLILPLIMLLALFGLGVIAFPDLRGAPGLLLALTLHAVAPPTFSSPSLAALIGLNGAISLALLIACTAATPFVAPALAAGFFGPEVTISPMALGLRLVLILAGAACAATAIRAVAGKAWVERQAERLDGISVIVLFGFAIALMGNVLENVLARPLLVLGLIVLATAISLALSALTVLVFFRTGWDTALTLGHAAGSRNMGLMLAAAAGAVPELVWLYVALAQFPIYLLPLPFKPLVRALVPVPDSRVVK